MAKLIAVHVERAKNHNEIPHSNVLNSITIVVKLFRVMCLALIIGVHGGVIVMCRWRWCMKECKFQNLYLTR
jgi:hypothetical protein